MTTIYKCDTCGQEFKSSKECRICEASHMAPADRNDYYL
nr:MAG TPA: hydrogenase/urease nickel incorporation protein [Caudoviricetes sp.]